jgi:hypothetical protein
MHKSIVCTSDVNVGGPSFGQGVLAPLMILLIPFPKMFNESHIIIPISKQNKINIILIITIRLLIKYTKLDHKLLS